MQLNEELSSLEASVGPSWQVQTFKTLDSNDKKHYEMIDSHAYVTQRVPIHDLHVLASICPRNSTSSQEALFSLCNYGHGIIDDANT